MTNWTISTKLFTLAAIGGVGSIAVRHRWQWALP